MPQSTWNPGWLSNNDVTISGNSARVSRIHLDRSPDESASGGSQVFSHSGGSTYESPISASFLPSSAVVVVPLNTECAEFFQYLGFRPEVAANLWSAWNGLPTFDKDNFVGSTFQFSQHWLQDRASIQCETRNDDWQMYLFTTLGLQQGLVDAIMDSTFADLRLTAPALNWVQETQRDRNSYLQDRMRASNNTTNSPGAPNYTSASGYGATFPTGDVPPGFTVLWRGCTQTAAKRMWPAGVIHQGQFNLNAMCPPLTSGNALTGDLNLKDLGSYWSDQLRTAQHYAGYTFRRNTYDNVPVSVYLVRLQIPNIVLESVGTIILDHPSAQFKETIWRSRAAKPVSASVRHVKRARVRIAHVCKSVDETFSEMDSPSQIGDAQILRIDIDGTSTMARQHFLQDDDDLNEAIEQACSQSITYHNHREPDRRLLLLN